MLNSIKLKLKAFDHLLLEKAVTDIVMAVNRASVRYSGPIPMPKIVEKFIVNRSTNVDKKSREQFQRISHCRLLVIESSPKAVESLKKLDISSGVSIKIIMSGGKND
jgi:small subunit ribosomal protein S10